LGFGRFLEDFGGDDLECGRLGRLGALVVVE
jgi:hypothetical protein